LGRNREAVEVLTEVLDSCPDFYLAHYNIGVAYEALGNFRDAEFHYAKASQLEAKLSTRDPSIHNPYGFLLLRLRKFKEAEKENKAMIGKRHGSIFLTVGIKADRF